MTLWLEHLRGGRVSYHNARGISTRCLEAGDAGPVVVMLHGTWGHAEAFIRNVVALAATGYRIYAIDMIGHGFTDRPRGCTYELSDYVEHLFSFLDDIGAGDAHVLGESLGGWVAMHAALTDPQRIRTVVNVVGGGLRPIAPTPAERAGWDTLQERSQGALQEPTFETWRARMEWLVHDAASMSDELVRTRMAINASQTNRDASAAIFSTVARMLREEVPGAISADRIRSVTVPVLYLWTDHNPTTPAVVAEAAHELTKDSEFYLMRDCGHWPQYEKADEFNAVVRQFLDGH